MDYYPSPRPQDCSYIGRPIPYISGPHAGKTIRAELQECQKPDLGRKFAKRDRRPIDPPPVVRVRLWEVYDSGLPTQSERELPAPDVEISGLVAHVDLFRVNPDDSIVDASEEDTAQLTMQIFGNTFVAAGQILDMTGQSVIIFVFATTVLGGDPAVFLSKLSPQDLSVRLEGRFALRYRFLNLVSRVEGSEGIPIAAELYGGPFTVFSTKEFPGLQPSTSLTKHLSRWCIRVNLREGERKRKSLGGDDDDDDNDDAADNAGGDGAGGDDEDNADADARPSTAAGSSKQGGKKPAIKRGRGAGSAATGGSSTGKGKGKTTAKATKASGSAGGDYKPPSSSSNPAGSSSPSRQTHPPVSPEGGVQGQGGSSTTAGGSGSEQQQQPFEGDQFIHSQPNLIPSSSSVINWSRPPSTTVTAHLNGGGGSGSGGSTGPSGGWSRGDPGGVTSSAIVPNWSRRPENFAIDPSLENAVADREGHPQETVAASSATSSRKRTRLMAGAAEQGYTTSGGFEGGGEAPPSSAVSFASHSPTFVDPNVPATTASPSSSYQNSAYYRTPPMLPAQSPQQRSAFTSGVTYAIPPPLQASTHDHHRIHAPSHAYQPPPTHGQFGYGPSR
ncbi:hypothetical protein FRB96_003089 [Tulasnella sp. 330]|nr:hypothetical protein FRB96_003089 [Tulasnella sp. 330]KAG8873015.1 hypothetical protein FRB97_007120 [Tulasnella sp. 331]KAG8876804.1 hypothetical protein FRB98_007026 [Tulasnella sp. 332]